MFESSFSGCNFHLLQELGERGIEPIEGALSRNRRNGLERIDGAKRPGVEAGVEHGDLRAGLGDAIAMAVRDPFNEAVQPEPPEVVGHRAGRIGRRIAALELGDVIAQLPMPEAGGGKCEEAEGVHQCVDAAVAEAKTGGPLSWTSTGAVTAWRWSSPMRQSWLRDSTCNNRRLAAKPISRSAGRLWSARPMAKS